VLISTTSNDSVTIDHGVQPGIGLESAPVMIRFFILFVLFLSVLFTAEILQPVQQHVIVPFTAIIADICVWLVNLFDDDVAASGKIIRSISNGFAVEIQPGCNGVEAVIILFSALFAFPAPFKHKLAGFAAGFFAIQLLNLVRIISLFYLGQWNMTAFKWFHLYLWQALIILDALVVWLIWLRYIPQPRQLATEPAAA
jgi:exosortase H (IPTLxxWG-CTERM-specific)